LELTVTLFDVVIHGGVLVFVVGLLALGFYLDSDDDDDWYA
jgi:hypothetical protein